MFHKVKTVWPFGCLRLLVWFEGGEARVYDCKPLTAKFEPFLALEYDSSLFEGVRVVGGGYGIEWNDDLDLSCDELYRGGRPVDLVEGERLRIISEVVAARETAGVSQSRLEKASGVSQPVIARLERGETAPQLDTLLKVLAPLGKTLKVVDLGVEVEY